MLTSKELRAKARDALRGNWGVAIAVNVVASLLSGGVSFSNSGSANAEGYLSFINQDAWIMLSTFLVVYSLVVLVIGGAINLGLHWFSWNLIQKNEVRFSMLFDYFHQLWRGFCMTFIIGLFTFLWTLLFIIPGIIAAYRYSMVPFLMAEFPDLGVMDAMRESKRLMDGNKWRLFCLGLSFFGWVLLCCLTLGIGLLWLYPYIQTARAAFYQDVTGRAVREYSAEF